MAEWIDISVNLGPNCTPLFPGTPPVRFEKILSLSKNDHADDTVLHFGIHSGTHLDMPSHFIKGAADIDSIELHKLIGRCLVVDMRGLTIITEKDLEKADIPLDTKRILFKTDNSKLWSSSDFYKNFVGISLEASQWLARRQIFLVGNDYLSIQPFGASNQIHIELLKENIIVLEGLDLSKVDAGYYDLMCLPLKVTGTEGAPARALLKKSVN